MGGRVAKQKTLSKYCSVSILAELERVTIVIIVNGSAIIKDYGWLCVADSSSQVGQAHHHHRTPWCVCVCVSRFLNRPSSELSHLCP